MDTRPKLNIHKTFTQHPKHHMSILCTLTLGCVSTREAREFFDLVKLCCSFFLRNSGRPESKTQDKKIRTLINKNKTLAI